MQSYAYDMIPKFLAWIDCYVSSPSLQVSLRIHVLCMIIIKVLIRYWQF